MGSRKLVVQEIPYSMKELVQHGRGHLCGAVQLEGALVAQCRACSAFGPRRS